MPFRKFVRLFGAIVLGLVGTSVLGSGAGSTAPIEAGPAVHEFKATLTGGDRTEVAGPLLNFETDGPTESWGLPPLMSYQRDRLVDMEEFDFLYPLLTYDRFGGEYKMRWFLMTTWTGGSDQADLSRSRFTLFPFYFQQRSPDPARCYTALFPFYGTIQERLQRDEIFFALFPIYSRSVKRGVVTENYLYPIVHRRHGEGVKGWQVWPIAGYETREPAEKRDSDGDVQIVPGHEKLFVLWPIFFNQHLGLGTTNVQSDHVLLPFYSLSRSPARDSSSYLWPFFTHIDDHAKQYREWQLPWPLVLFARGEGKTANRIWPFFSQVQGSVNRSEFYLWPVYKRNRTHAPPLERDRQRILFFLYSDLSEKNIDTGTEFHRTDLWPLFTARRDHEGKQRLQILSPLEPFLPNNKSVERNYSPLWSLWRSERNPKTGAASESLLWNLYRNDRTPQTKKCSLLFGLFRYQAGPDGRQWRVFYIPVATSRKPSGS